MYLLDIHGASFRVHQQTSAFEVPAVNVERSYVATGLVNQTRRLCPSFPSESTFTPSSFSLYKGGGGRKELLFFTSGLDWRSRMRRLGYLNNCRRE